MAPSYATASRMRYYSDTASATIASEASPHRLVSMLYDGILTRLATARSAIASGDLSVKLRAVNGALAIVEHLRVVLDHEAGGALAERLDSLYEYAYRRMVQGNAANDPDALAEVSRLVATVKNGWDQIAPGGAR